MNVLIFPAGTEIAMEIRNALKDEKHIHLVGATSVPCHAEMVFEELEELPFVNHPDFIWKLNEIIARYDIDYIYPAHDDALLFLVMNDYRIHARVVASFRNTVQICRHKKITYERLKGYLTPKVFPDADAVDEYPVFIKPDIGQGSQGARRIDSREELDRALADGTDYVICEYLPGEEITVDCFTDHHGELRWVNQRSRDRIRSGIAVRSRYIPYEPWINDTADVINKNLDFVGAWFFQMKKDSHGDWKLLEVAPRIAGTMGLTRNIGVNLPLLTLYAMEKKEVEIFRNDYDILVDRAFISRYKPSINYHRVYVDFDDTIIVKGKVNPMLIAFLYQAKDKGKNLYLITRHNGNILDKMEQHHIPQSLFDGIIIVGDGALKSEYIWGDSIFIDDSFAERKEVHENSKVDVFSVDMVESLIDWRI